jgi:two-component system chemotaxis sensor kinase CheA
LLVDWNIDIVDDRLDIQVGSARPGVLGSAIIRGQATEIIDVGHFLPLAYEDWFRRKEEGGSGHSRRLLLVDESAFFRDMLTPVLKAAGYHVTTAASGEGALALLEADRFDVVVTDIDMTGMTGLEFAKALRSNPRTARLPIIALSSVISPEAIEQARAAGLNDYVAKFDRQSLIAALKQQTADVGRAA